MSVKPIASAAARELILAGAAPAGLAVSGHLDLSGQMSLRELPAGLTVLSLDLKGCVNLERLPIGLKVSVLRLDSCAGITELPADFSCQALEFRNGSLQRLPPGLRVRSKLDLSGCVRLTELPDGLSVQRLILSGCVSLAALPATLDVEDLDVSGCVALAHWPGPTYLRLHRLNVAGCARLHALPDDLMIDDSLELARSGLTGIPDSMANAALRWRGVAMTERAAFRLDSFSAEEILAEPNLEVRRIQIERVGYEWIFQQASAVILDSDRDAGGERVLRRIMVQRDEDLICLSVKCPSTGRGYTLRVPPHMASCRQAAAWLAGFDNPDDYHPIVET